MIFEMWKYNSWGKSIKWLNFSDRSVYGHSTPVPKEGDKLYCKMQSGKVATFEFIEVEQMSNPRDQFFAKVKDTDYLKEAEMPHS
jgi:hypothetical protein